ncbi:MAG: polyphosphate polymerase domain-containing protein [Prevotella sp.]|nr:polyphosphate polymerase domain-containing protein [Prevotella sp.]
MQEILNRYEPITLEEMKDIRLMNRIDTKFVTTVPVLKRLLELAREDYFVQETGGLRISPYYTLYFDTADCAMYNRHEAGHLVRQKLRIRSYVDAGLNFLEVKTKNNHGRTKKKRMTMEGFDAVNPDHTIRFERQDEQYIIYDNFLREHLHYDPATLSEQLENRFDRITLVNKAKTERLTIDSNLRFHNIATDNFRFMGDIVIIELKRDGLKPSPILSKLLELRIHPHGFSKYCIGSALTNDDLRRNRIKPRLHSIEKIVNQ